MPAQMIASPAIATSKSPRLLDQVRAVALAHFGRKEPVERYVAWALRFIVLHGRRHPSELGMVEIRSYLEHVAKSEKDPLSALEQAREALAFLYVQVQDNHAQQPALRDELRAMGREAIKDVRNSIHEVFLGQREGPGEPGAPLNNTQAGPPPGTIRV